MVPHGIAVVVNAPAAFRFTAPAAAKRHMQAAAALGVEQIELVLLQEQLLWLRDYQVARHPNTDRPAA